MKFSTICLFVALGSVMVLGPAVAAAQCKWTVTHAHDRSQNGDLLNGVFAVSRTDAWAVGAHYDPFFQAFKPLTEHWDGNEWTIVPAPGVRAHKDDRLAATTAASSDDVWAVGNEEASGVEVPLIEHWNGASWTLVPMKGLPSTFLSGVAAVESSDVWMVGASSSAPGLVQTFVGHWDGAVWSQVPSPNVGSGSNELNGVAARSSSDVWAVGAYVDSSGVEQTLTEHWDGSVWSIVPSPDESVYGNRLDAVTMITRDDAWAVGTYNDGVRFKALVEHWNGVAWTLVHGVSPGTEFSILNSISAVGPQDVWTVGIRGRPGNTATLTEHWDGSRWSVVQSPDFANEQTILAGVSAILREDVLAVGSHGSRALGLRFHC
ncbi:MAG TPA: hypothetical protein VFO25_05425 [Candidatus Eremiobacteraceae bacterium]|nr:hypothetical protein [Candidatus Eremiobacteraceae bacterium]